MSTRADIRELTIDPEFRDLLPKLDPIALAELEASIERDGLLSPIIVWANHDDTIIDGYHRYPICVELGTPIKTKALSFDTRDDVKEWMLTHQGARRNSTPEQLAYMRGCIYELRKKKRGGDHGNQHTQEANGQNVRLADNVAEQVATEHNVDEKTIRRDGAYARGINAIGDKLGAAAKQSVLSGDVKLTKAAIEKLGKIESPTKAQVEEVMRTAKQPSSNGHASTGKRNVVPWEKALAAAAKRKRVTKEEMNEICGSDGKEYSRQRLDVLVASQGFIVTKTERGYRVRRALHIPMEDAKANQSVLDAIARIKKLALDAKKLVLHTGSDHFSHTDAVTLVSELERITSAFPCD